MSRVTNVILAFQLGENVPDVIQDIDEWLDGFGGEQKFGSWAQNIGQPHDGCTGGSKHMEVHVLMAAFDHIPADPFVDFVKQYRWKYAERVTLFIQDKDDDKFVQRI